MKIYKKKNFCFGGGGGPEGGGDVGFGGHAGCERRIEVFVKIHKKKNYLGGGGSQGGRGGGLGGQGGCEQRIEVFVKIKKKLCVGGGGGRVDVNEELKFLGKVTQKN